LANDTKVYDPRKFLGPAREAIKETVRGKMREFGSSGKAQQTEAVLAN
jgi:fructose-bisphosphate aldolase class II